MTVSTDNAIKELRQLLSSNPLVALEPEGIAALSQLATDENFGGGTVLNRQFEEADVLYLLLEGEVSFLLQLEQGNEGLKVGGSAARWTPIGWSGFKAPHRYATTVVCKQACRALAFDHGALAALFEQYPGVGIAFLQLVLRQCVGLLQSTRDKLAGGKNTPWNYAKTLDGGGEEEAYNRAPPEFEELLKRSPFFEVFSRAELAALAKFVDSQYFCRGEPICVQGADAAEVHVLATGRVALNFSANESATGSATELSPIEDDPSIPEAAAQYTIRMMSDPGEIVSWGSQLTVPRHDISAVATRDCTLFRLKAEGLSGYIRNHPAFGVRFFHRMLWLISNHLRAARAHFISLQFEQEVLTVRNLVEQSCTQLSVNSQLHKVPHLLQSAYTLGDAFECLHSLSESDNAVERGLAHLCLEMLDEVRREHDFFEALRRVYELVVSAPADATPVDLRRACAVGFKQAFRGVRSVVRGQEHLPERPGHIFIFNHLKNHEYNTLPNNFQLTLDSHFVSSVLLFEKYGDPGIRVTRQSRGQEYGHQRYYDRLGHIAVYTHESDQLEESTEQRAERRRKFYDVAAQYLYSGTNLILSPEGTSHWTEDSPGLFKPGAFRLAANMAPEPLIVPIAVANFDRRVHSTTVVADIQRPFRLSEKLNDPENYEEMREFLRSYRRTFRDYVAGARQLGEENKG